MSPCISLYRLNEASHTAGLKDALWVHMDQIGISKTITLKQHQQVLN